MTQPRPLICARPGFWRVVGLAFCIVWAAALVVFPYHKGMVSGYIPVAVGLFVGGMLCGETCRHRLNRALTSPPTWLFLVGVVVIAAVLRVAPLLLYSPVLASDAAIYHSKAIELLAGEGYGQTAFLPPGLPILLAGWYALTSPTPMWGFVISGLASIAAVVVARDVGRRAISELAGRWAAVMLAVMPTLVFTATDIHTTSLQLLAFLACADLALLSLRPGRRGWAAVIMLGVVLGFGSLVKPVLLIGPAVVLLTWLALGARWKCVLRLGLCIAVMAAFVVPWAVRNYRLFGAVVPVSTNGGYVLYHGTNPESGGMWAKLPEPPPGGWGDESVRDRTLRGMALGRIRGDPMSFARLAVQKQTVMWGTSSTNIAVRLRDDLSPGIHWALSSGIKAIVNAGWAALWLLCFAATIHTRVWSNRRLRPLVLLLLMTFVLHLFYEVQSRYHISVISALVLIAAAGLAASPRTTGLASGGPE